MTYGDVILQYRKDHNLSQRAFSMKCGLSNSYIAFLENNRNPTTGKTIKPTIESLTQIAKAMDMDLGEFLSMVDGDSPVVINKGNTHVEDGTDVRYLPYTLDDTRVLCAGFEEMPPETRAMIMGMFNAAYSQFKQQQGKDEDDDTADET